MGEEDEYSFEASVGSGTRANKVKRKVLQQAHEKKPGSLTVSLLPLREKCLEERRFLKLGEHAKEIRGCCGKILLNRESDLSDEPYEEHLDRSEFHSWQDFASYLDNWCEQRKLEFSIRHSVALNEDDISKYPLGPEIARSLRYRVVRLGCRGCSRKSCPAFIKLRLGHQKDRLVIAQTILQHNHELTAAAVPPEAKSCKLLMPTDRPSRIANDISRKFLEPNDLKRLFRYMPGGCEAYYEVLEELKSLFMADPWAKVKLVFVEDQGMLKNIFIMTSGMQDVAQRLPGHLCVDVLSNFNPGFDLFIVMCEEENSQWNVCAYCISKTGTTDTLRVTLISLMQSIASMHVQVKRITVSPEILETLDLGTLIPHASIRYCNQSVLKMLHQKIRHLDATVQAQIKVSLQAMACTQSPDIYSQCLSEMLATCPVDLFQYYYGIWHPRKNFWVQEQSTKCVSMDAISSVLKAKRRMLVDQAGHVSSLAHCLKVILSENFMVLESKESLQLHKMETNKMPDGGNSCPEEDEVDEEEEEEEEEGFSDSPSDLSFSTGQVATDDGDLQGMEFSSWDAFCEYFDLWCEARNALYRIRKAIPVKKGIANDSMANLKYRCVQLVCKSYPGSELERSSPSNIISSCPAAITVRASKDTNCLVIVQARTYHNHESDASNFDKQFERFHLATWPDLSAKLSNLSQTFLTAQSLQELMSLSDGLEPGLGSCLKELEKLFSLDPGVKVKLGFLSDTATVESIFLMTSQTKKLLRSFPSILVMGRSLAISETFDLYTVLCNDANGMGRECAYFITRGDSPTPIGFMVVWLLRSLPEVKPLIDGLILRADLKELDLIRDLLPTCCVRMSQTHALDTLYRRASLEDSAIQQKLKTLIYNLVHASTPILYRFHYQELEAASPRTFLQYFCQAWNERKEDWAKSWGHKIQDGHFLDFAAKQPRDLRSVGNFPCSLVSCIQALCKVTTIQSTDEEIQRTVVIKSETPEECIDMHVDPDNPSICIAQDRLVPEEHLHNKVMQASLELRGREFLSWNEFRDLFDEWCEKNRFLYKMKSYITIDKSKTVEPMSTSTIVRLRYSYIRLVCINSLNVPWAKRRSKRDTSICQANVILRVGPNFDRLIVEQAKMEHNHGVTEEEFATHYPQCRLKSKPYFLLELTNSLSKQFLVAQDVQKLLGRNCDEKPVLQDLLKELSALFVADKNIKLKLVFYPDETAVQFLFLMTSQMKCLLQRFPSILFFDRSLSVNNNFNLYTVLCEDANGRGRECAYFLSRKDSQTPVRFMVVSLMQSIPDVLKSEIKSVVLHADLAELELIRALLPKRTVVMSQAYALEALYNRVDQEDSSVHLTLKENLQKLVLSNTSEAFEGHMKDFEAVSLKDFFTYFKKNWHPSKKMWVACWGLEKPERSRFSLLVLRHQLMLQSALSPPVTPAECMSGLMQLQSLKLLTAALNVDKLCALYQSFCPPASLKLMQKEMTLTKQGCYEMTEVDGGFLLNDGISNFRIDKDIACCTCSIFTSNLLPCRHLFAARLWAGEPIFDLKLIH